MRVLGKEHCLAQHSTSNVNRLGLLFRQQEKTHFSYSQFSIRLLVYDKRKLWELLNTLVGIEWISMTRPLHHRPDQSVLGGGSYQQVHSAANLLVLGLISLHAVPGGRSGQALPLLLLVQYSAVNVTLVPIYINMIRSSEKQRQTERESEGARQRKRERESG